MILAAVHHIQCRWDKSLKWLRRQEWKNDVLYDQVVCLLQNISWGGTVQGFDSTGHCPVSMIATYLSDNWLSDNYMHQFTELLKCHLLSNARHASETYVMGPWFLTHLSQFNDHPNHPYLEHISLNLASGCRKCIVSMRNVSANHWIAIGDSFKKPHHSFLSAASQWVKRHMKCTYKQTTLPCMDHWQTDGFSCGILVMNAIKHYLDPEHYPLVGNTPYTLAAS